MSSRRTASRERHHDSDRNRDGRYRDDRSGDRDRSYRDRRSDEKDRYDSRSKYDDRSRYETKDERTREYSGRDSDRDRDYDRSRDKDRYDDRDRERDEERRREEERRRREREELKGIGFGERAAYIESKKKEEAVKQAKLPTLDDVEDLDDAAMLEALGLPSGFGSTAGKHVVGANPAMANVKSKREYRQYMNRKGGFNRLLDNKQ